MREWKFKVWNKIKKVWILYDFRIDEDGDIFDSFSREWLVNFELVEYIGCKDIDGKKIFRGDIVSFNSKGNIFLSKDYDQRGERKVNPEIIYSEVVFGKNGAYFFEGQYGFAGIEVDFDRVKIVGNTFENPELLKIAELYNT